MFTHETYYNIFTAIQKELKLKIGDTVTVARKPLHKDAPGHPSEYGWDDWSHAMDKTIGKSYTVVAVEDNGDVHLSNTYYYPITLLEVVSQTREPIEINSSYSAVVQDNGDVQVGCTLVPREVLWRIYDESTDAFDNYTPPKKVVKKVAKKRAPARRRSYL